MCPVCWAAIVAQVLFFATLGLILVVVTDLKFGLPLALVTLVITTGSWCWEWEVNVWTFYGLGALLLSRAVWILAKHESNWVRVLSLKISKWFKRKLRPLVYGSSD
jgi:hypothetical protein